MQFSNIGGDHRASSRVSNFAAEGRPGPSLRHRRAPVRCGPHNERRTDILDSPRRREAARGGHKPVRGGG